MRNIRVAAPGDRIIDTPRPSTGRGRFRRVRDWLLTIPVVLLLPAVILLSAPAAATGPTISVGPSAAARGTVLSVDGHDFPKHDAGKLAWDGSMAGMPSYSANGAGKFHLTWSVPTTATIGSHALAAIAVAGDGQKATERARTIVEVGLKAAIADQTVRHGRGAKDHPTAAPTASSAPGLLGQSTVPTSGPTTAPSLAPSANPTTAPTSAPTPAPTSRPTATPAPVSASCGRTLQSMVDGATSGSTLRVPNCTYHETVTIRKPLTVLGPATITGDGSRSHGIVIASSDVTLEDLSVTNVANALQTGAIDANGQDRVHLRDVSATKSHGACISIADSSGSSVTGSLMSGCTQEGYHFSRVTGLTFSGNRVTGNNAARSVDPGWEAGGGKTAGGCSSLTFSDNEVDHNGGPGIWFDIHCTGITVSGNRVHDNWAAGIMFEISSSARITGNVVWHNAIQSSSPKSWGWGAGILVSSSNHVQIDHNTVAWNGDGISVISQNRSDAPASVTGNTVTSNTIFGSDTWPASSQNYGLAWLQDWSGAMFSASSGNHASGNTFWFGTAEGTGRYGWANDLFSSLSKFSATPGGSGSSYLTSSQKSSILAGKGLPIAP